MTDRLRGFAQGLLLEAIDASFKVGFIQAIFEASANPTTGVKSVVKDFTEKALLHWFDNLTAGHELKKVKIYDLVRNQLAVSFRKYLYDFLAKNGIKSSFGALLAYKRPSDSSCCKVWSFWG